MWVPTDAATGYEVRYVANTSYGVATVKASQQHLDSLGDKLSELDQERSLNPQILDFANDDDIITIWFKRSVEINGQQMWHQKWSRDFKPEEDLPIASVWALLPKLQMHLTQLITSVVGTPLEMDKTTRGNTSPIMAKRSLHSDNLVLWVTKPFGLEGYLTLFHGLSYRQTQHKFVAGRGKKVNSLPVAHDGRIREVAESLRGDSSV
uniref:Uncharacterized protein n=1 Tax=Solanum lycopersicum TaxID=4081 RepID=A0A3Q7FIU2_SOLLC